MKFFDKAYNSIRILLVTSKSHESTTDRYNAPYPSLRKITPNFTALAFVLLLGATLRLSDLSGTRFTTPDEFRTIFFSKFQTPFLSLTYQIGAILLGPGQEAAIYFTAILGTLCIWLTYTVGKEIGSWRSGLVAAALFSVNGVALRYSRSGYPVMLQTLIILFAMLCILKYLKKNETRHLRIVAVFLPLAFFTYLPSYAPVCALIVTLGIALVQSGIPKKGIALVIISLVLYAFGVGASFILADILIETGSLDLTLYVHSVGRFNAITKLFVSSSPLLLFEPFIESLSVGGVTLSAALLAAVILRVRKTVLGTSSVGERFIIHFIIIAYILFTVTGFCKAHTLYARHYAYLMPFYCILAGQHFADLSKVNHPVFVKSVLAIILLAGIPSSLSVINATFKVRPITTWFSERQISLSSVVTGVDLSSSDSGVEGYQSIKLPVTVIGYPYGRLGIEWTEVEKLYRSGQAQYLLTSGIGTSSTIGLQEPRLQVVQPLIEWPHPYSFYGHPFYPNPREGKFSPFRIFDLATIFSEKSQND